MDYTDKILTILTHGRHGKEIGSRKLFEIVRPEDSSLQTFQRLLTKELEVYQDAQVELALAGKPFFMIMSNDKGYYVAETEQQAIDGLLFYQSRMQPMFTRRKKIKQMIALKFKRVVKDRHKIQEAKNQIGMF